jgi:hypothetical protein
VETKRENRNEKRKSRHTTQQERLQFTRDCVTTTEAAMMTGKKNLEQMNFALLFCSEGKTFFHI